jgi:heptaprenylglyceryl phosphate synthase
MKRLLVALVVVIASMTAGVGGGVASVDTPAVATSAGSNTIVLGLFDMVQGFIERLDQLLESIADLLKTLQTLSGGEGGD